MQNDEFGSRIVIVRKVRNWTQAELGLVLFSNQTRICALEKGRRDPSLIDLYLLAKNLCFCLDTLLFSEPFDLAGCLRPMTVEKPKVEPAGKAKG